MNSADIIPSSTTVRVAKALFMFWLIRAGEAALNIK